MNVDVDR